MKPKTVVINEVDPADHEALAAYASVYNVRMSDAFARAVKSLVAGLDGAEKVIYDRILANPEGRRRRGRPVGNTPAGEGGAV